MFDEALEAVKELQEKVSRMKYQHDGEKTFDDVLQRVVCEARKFYKYDTVVPFDRVEKMLLNGRFVPGGSILFGLGNTKVRCSLSNCYVTPIQQDSLEGIFDALKHAARTYSYRGGTGIDITILRPKAERVHNAALSSSGAVSFMPLISEVTNAIGQNGRRGACMISIDIRHPDVMDFIWAKSRPEKVFGKDFLTGKVPDIYGANISVKLTDKFMEAVRDNADWTFVFPDRDADPELYDTTWKGDYATWTGKLKKYNTVKAVDLLKEIAEAAHTSGDPGVLFIDTVHDYTPGVAINNILKPMTTNPCGEQPIGPYNNCLLGAMVLWKYVENPFTDSAKFDEELFLSDVEAAVTLMNTFSDINVDLHPLQEQRDADRYGKRIGIEFTGLGDMLAMLGIRYGTEDSISFVKQVMRKKAIKEIETSWKIAHEGICAPAFYDVPSRVRFLNSKYIINLDLPEELRRVILADGLANTAFNTVGPTGSISIMSNNCTSGIEPLFMFSYSRQTRLDPNKYFNMIHKPALDYIIENNLKGSVEELKEKLNYVEAWEIDWRARIDMQAAVQQYTDSSISSTINLPNSVTPKEIMDIYYYAWEKKLKGVTIFRDGCKKGVLSAKQETEHNKEAGYNKETEGNNKNAEYNGPLIKELLDEERAVRHRVHWKGSKIYIIVTLDEEDSPLEVFVKLPRESGVSEREFQEKFSLWESVTRLTSLLLRAGIPVEKIVEQLNKASYSVVDAAAIMCRVLKKYIPGVDEEDEDIVNKELGETCPECRKKAYVLENGCGVCKHCGYTTCG